MPQLNARAPLCPSCRRVLDRKMFKQSFCECGVEFRIAYSYKLWTVIGSGAILLITGYLTYTPQAGGAWLLGLFLLWLPLRLLLMLYFPLKLELGREKFRASYIACVIGTAIALFAVEFVGFGWMGMAVGASKQEMAEHLEFLSVPLGWLSHAFIIRPDKTFLDVCGIILGNSFFYGFGLYICFNVVHAAFRKNRVMQMNISGSIDITDDD